MKKIVIAIVIAAAGIGGFAWWKSSQEKSGIEILASGTVDRGTVRKVLEETGIIKSQVGAIVKIGARATGTIERMLVKVGDPVEKGELVAVIDSRELRSQEAEGRAQLETAQAVLDRVREVYPLQIAEARAHLAQDRAQTEYLQASWRRKQQLHANRFASEDELEDARQKADVQARQVEVSRTTLERIRREFEQQEKKAVLSVRNAEANLETLGTRISYTRIESPLSGVVSQVTAQEGETIVAGLQVANLITVLDPSRLEMWVYVDETDIGQVREGQDVEFRVDAYPDRTFEGTIDAIYPEPEIRDNIVYYRALVEIGPEQAKWLRPEMTTQVRIVTAEKADILTLPNTALKWVEGRQIVFVRDGDGAVRQVSPVIGLSGLDRSEIVEGLSEGEQVATQVLLPRSAARRGEP